MTMASVNLWHDIEKDENYPEIVKIIVETPKGSRNRYEYDKKYNLIRLDRIADVQCPGNCGFIPQTYAEDGNPLEAFVFTTETTYPGILLKARPLALLRIVEENLYTDKIICVGAYDPYIKKELSEELKGKIEELFKVYKRLEGKTVKSFEWKDASVAKRVIERAINLYERKFS